MEVEGEAEEGDKEEKVLLAITKNGDSTFLLTVMHSVHSHVAYIHM